VNGAPFVAWQLPAAMNKIKARYMDTKGGGRDFVELLMLLSAMQASPVGNGFRNME